MQSEATAREVKGAYARCKDGEQAMGLASGFERVRKAVPNNGGIGLPRAGWFMSEALITLA